MGATKRRDEINSERLQRRYEATRNIQRVRYAARADRTETEAERYSLATDTVGRQQRPREAHTANRAYNSDTKQDTDTAYNDIVQGALRLHYGPLGTASRRFPALNLLVASHNRDSVLAAHRLHQDRVKAGLPTVPVVYAQLHGMSDEVSFELLQAKGEC